MVTLAVSAREGLVLDLAEVRAVEGVGVVGAEGLDFEVFGAPAHLFVGGEGDPDRAVLELRVVLEPRDGRHDLRNSRLVVGAEEGGTPSVWMTVWPTTLLEVGIVVRLEDLLGSLSRMSPPS